MYRRRMLDLAENGGPSKRCRYASLATAWLCWSSRSTSTDAALQVAVLSGSTRTDGPPRPILAPRVGSFVKDALVKRGNIVVTHIDASSLTLLEKPEFAFAKSRVPPHLKKMHADLSCADAFVVITPEYNHAPCPGVVNILNHFGASVFGFKPSAIVSYSAGQWGGTRAAHGLRPILSELGCLPVSAMIHIPHAGQVFDENGDVIDVTEQEKWGRYAQRCFSQLEWWGEAAKQHKHIVDPTVESPAFQSTPSERNPPAS